MGFGLKQEAESAIPEDQQRISAESFHKFGFLPELMGRFSRVVQFSPLEKETLKQILRQNVLPRYVDEFRGEGIKLTVSPKALDHIVTEAQVRQTGARGLEAELLQTLEETAYETFLQGQQLEVKVTVKGGELKAEVVG